MTLSSIRTLGAGEISFLYPFSTDLSKRLHLYIYCNINFVYAMLFVTYERRPVKTMGEIPSINPYMCCFGSDYIIFIISCGIIVCGTIAVFYSVQKTKSDMVCVWCEYGYYADKFFSKLLLWHMRFEYSFGKSAYEKLVYGYYH